MAQNKKQLEGLLKFIGEVNNQPGNEWFKNDLIKSLVKSSDHIESPILDEIYEYCINTILKTQAEKFYADFELIDIKPQLVNDFIRMEQFRRCDNFEDFGLAAFQQIEAIVNKLCDANLESFIINNKDANGYESTKSNNKLWQVVFYFKLPEIELKRKLSQPILKWSFIEKYRAVLYYYYFERRVYNYIVFDEMADIGSELYQIRNANHRGGEMTENQILVANRVKGRSNRYFLKFLGFIEDFTSRINENIKIIQQ